MRIWIALFAVLMLAACARAPLDPAADRAARDFYAAVEQGDWPKVEQSLSPNLARANNREGFERLRAALPHAKAREAREVGWTEGKDGAIAAVHLYRFADSDVVVRTTLQPQAGRHHVASFMANRVPLGEVEANRFTFGGKGAQHYGFLATAFLSPLVMVVVAAMAAMAKGLRFKIAWMALALVGVGEAWINWTTGQGGFTFAQISLVNVGVARATDISPWILNFSLPLGALVTLARLLTLPEKDEAAPA